MTTTMMYETYSPTNFASLTLIRTAPQWPQPIAWLRRLIQTDTKQPTTSTRRVTGHDAQAIFQLYRQLSPESLYMRFNTDMSHVSAEFWHHLAARTAADCAANGYGLLMYDEASELPVAMGRYVRAGNNSAELAFEVSDTYQGQGLGSQLMQALVQQAKRANLDTLEAVVDQDNGAMQRLIHGSGHLFSVAYAGSLKIYTIYLRQTHKTLLSSL